MRFRNGRDEICLPPPDVMRAINSRVSTKRVSAGFCRRLFWFMKGAGIMGSEKILSNKAKCLICGDIIESTSTHDFKRCSCGNLAVDGGVEYIRRLCAGGADGFEELSDIVTAQE